MNKKIEIVSPYEVAKQADFKSVKAKKTSKTYDRYQSRNHENEGDFWDTSGSSTTFDAHPAARKAHEYGSSLRGGRKDD